MLKIAKPPAFDLTKKIPYVISPYYITKYNRVERLYGDSSKLKYFAFVAYPIENNKDVKFYVDNEKCNMDEILIYNTYSGRNGEVIFFENDRWELIDRFICKYDKKLKCYKFDMQKYKLPLMVCVVL